MTFCTWDGAAGSGLFTAEFCVEIQLSRTHHQQPPGGSPVDGIKPANYFGDTTLAWLLKRICRINEAATRYEDPIDLLGELAN